MKEVMAKYIGSFEVHSMRHDKVLNHGDEVLMPEAEAEARPDFEVLKPQKEGAKEKGGEK